MSDQSTRLARLLKSRERASRLLHVLSELVEVRLARQEQGDTPELVARDAILNSELARLWRSFVADTDKS